MQIEISFKKIVLGLLMTGYAAVILYGIYYIGVILYIEYALSHQGRTPF